MRSKQIKLDSISNIRDLSSIANKEGYFIKPKKLIRSERLCNATVEDMNKLYDEYDLRTIVDFRADIEFEQIKDTIVKDIKLVHCLLEESVSLGVAQDEETMRQREEFFKSLEDKCKNQEFAFNHMKGFYRYMGESEYTLSGYSKFVKELVNNENCILWHCSVGRDRAGCATAIILEILDVDRDTIIEDYLSTNDYIENSEMLTGAFSVFKYAQKEYIEEYYKTVEEKYGTFENYLKALGVTDEIKQILKNKYLLID